MTLAFLIHPNTVVAGPVAGKRGGRGSERERAAGKRIICRARRPFFHDAQSPITNAGEKKREGERKKGENDEQSGKRRRGAYQRHLLIYFASVGRWGIRGEGEFSLGLAPTRGYRHYRTSTPQHRREEREKKCNLFRERGIYVPGGIQVRMCIYNTVTSVT